MSQYAYYERGGNVSSSPSRITWAVQRLILANVVVFAGQLIVSTAAGGFVQHWLEFRPADLLRGVFWTPLTYMFLHAGLLHLFVNMLWLFFFGPDVERVLSTRQFFRFYLFCGAAGVMATFVPYLLRQSNPTILGASGAVMGVLAAFAVANPNREFFLFPLPFPINARAMVALVVVLNVVMAFTDAAVSVATHLGGLLAGYVYMKAAPWFTRGGRRGGGGGNDRDPIAEAVDNIFRFEDRKR